MHDFIYHRPSSIDEAAKRLGSADDGALLSGGQTLIPTLKQGLAMPSDVVDLSGLGNTGITVSGSAVTIKAGTCHADVASSEELKGAIPALAELAGHIGDPQVRNRGTIGGSIANNDPAADYPAACVGLGATIKTNSREIAADDFFVDMFETALEPGEIVTEISFPVPKKAGYAKFPNPASRYALVGVFVAETDGGVRVAVTGAGPCVFRSEELETALGGGLSDGTLDGVSLPADGLNGDLHASPDYRAHLVTVMARRAVARANG